METTHVLLEHDNREFMIVDEINIIEITPPKNTSHVPFLRDVKCLAVINDEERELYFSMVKKAYYCFWVVEGVLLNNYYHVIKCDFCEQECDKYNYKYCRQCHAEMCELCYEEMQCGIASEENTRVDLSSSYDLKVCKDHEIVTLKDIRYGTYFCDMCKKELNFCDSYSNYAEKNTDSEDLCMECAETETGVRIIRDSELQYYRFSPNDLPCGKMNFGSFLDYAVIYEDDSGGLILYNHNKDSVNHGKIALKTNCEIPHYDEKYGMIFVIEEPLSTVIDELEKLQSNIPTRLKRDIIRYYMIKKNIPVDNT